MKSQMQSVPSEAVDPEIAQKIAEAKKEALRNLKQCGALK
jgi:hypothetical protein